MRTLLPQPSLTQVCLCIAMLPRLRDFDLKEVYRVQWKNKWREGPTPQPSRACALRGDGICYSEKEWKRAAGAACGSVPCSFPRQPKAIYVSGGILPVWLEKYLYMDFHGRGLHVKAQFQTWSESSLSSCWILLPWAVLRHAAIPLCVPSGSHICACRRLLLTPNKLLLKT